MREVMRKFSKFKIAVLSLAAAALMSLAGEAGAEAARKDVHGRIAFGHMSIDDSSPAGDIDSTRIYYRLIAEDIAGWEDVAVHIDGRARSSSKNYNDDIPSNRLLLMNVEFRKVFNFMNITVGRSFIEEIVGHNVDGADIKLKFSRRSGAGLFGGMKPDPYDDSFNSDYLTYGAYLFSRSDEIGLAGGYAYDSFKGNKDRERIHGNLYVIPSTSFHVWSSLDVDNRKDTGGEGWEVSNLLVHGNWRPQGPFGMSFTYNEFRAVNRQAALLEKEYEYTGDKYSVARVSADFKFWGNAAVYGGFDQRNREFDSRSASQFYGGLRNNRFYFDTRWDVRYSSLDYFTSQVTAYYASLGATILENFNADFSVTMLTSSQDGLSNDMEQMVYELNVDWWLGNGYYAALTYQYSNEQYLDIDSIYASQYDDNFTTTALYLQAGYRF